MATTAEKVENALEREGLRYLFSAIENNPATPGEVVLWAGGGTPVYSVREALKEARERQEAEASLDD